MHAAACQQQVAAVHPEMCHGVFTAVDPESGHSVLKMTLMNGGRNKN
jgi:hypothetical protein